MKARCDIIHYNYNAKDDCSALLKLVKNDKVKLKVEGYIQSSTDINYTYFEGFLATPLP